MQKPQREALIQYFLGRSTAEEATVIEAYLALNIDGDYVEACLKEAIYIQEESDGDTWALSQDKTWSLLIQKQNDFQKNTPLRTSRFKLNHGLGLVAAAILCVLVSVSLFRLYQQEDKISADDSVADFATDTNKALLVLADGSTIPLSDIEDGEIALESGVHIEKKEDGSIIYHAPEDKDASSISYNTISTPRGGQFQITLPDGSKAWLNAASSLRYPVRFASNERRVQMQGEVYFEVAKQTNGKEGKRIPFFVEADKQTIEVLGTQFNVSAYTDDEAIKTTLLEGSVRIKGKDAVGSVLLKPGEQAVLSNGFQISKIHAEKYIAWKSGDFIFQAEPLESILRQVSRWYDVDVSLPEELKNIRFSGMVSRTKPLSTIVDIIQSTNKVHITLQGRRLIVTN